MESGRSDDRQRVERFLARGQATIRRTANAKTVLIEAGERGSIGIAALALAEMVRDGTVRLEGSAVSLNGDERGGQRVISTETVMTEHGATEVDINVAESPLAQLVRRKTKSGEMFLTRTEFEAGERLRSDYTRGQIMPRLGANWEASVSSGRRAGGVADLTEAALAARMRVERALVAVGPELSGLLVDVCCFLKGMETVEMERGWPVRSAKVVLKTALGVLGRHYTPPRRETPATALHWGAADYRPTIG